MPAIDGTDIVQLMTSINQIKSMTEDWKRFEHLTQKIQQQLTPDAIVGHNEFVVGKSGARNQLDVTLRSNIGQYKYFCVIECKDWKNKVDIDTVRAFQSKVKDVEAMQGVMVSSQGFTREAYKYAESQNICLYKLVDAESEKWSEAALIPIVITRINLRKAELRIIDNKTKQSIWLMDKNGKPAEEEKMYFFDPKLNRYIRIREFLEEKWDEIFKNKEPKSDEWFETEEGEFLLYEGDEKHIEIIVKFSLEAIKTWYYGNLSLSNCLGFVDQKTGKLLTPEYCSNPLIFRDIVKTWPKTTNKNEIPFSPEHTFFMGHFFSKNDHEPPNSVIIKKISS